MKIDSIRTIKSYAIRERLSGYQQNIFNTLFHLYSAPLTGPIIPSFLFKRSAVTIVEIGFGGGETLLDTACRYPEWNVFGIEVYRPGLVNVLRIAHSKKLTNLRVIYDDASIVFANRLPKESIQGISVYFPDPWPKRRHHKRRLFQAPFIHHIEKCLKKDGWIHIVTDWENYAKNISHVFDGFRDAFVQTDVPDDRRLFVATKFKTRAFNAGRDVHELFFNHILNPSLSPKILGVQRVYNP